MPRDDAMTISRLVSSAGDESDFQRLFERHVVAVEEAVARVWNLEVSEQAEAVEETFVHVFSRLKMLREPGRFDECLLGTAYGIALRRGRPDEHDGGFAEKPFISAPFSLVQGSRPEAETWLEEAVRTLPDETRALAEACFFGQKTRPQLLAATRSMEVAAVGACLDAAYARMKAVFLAHALERLLSTKHSAADAAQPNDPPPNAAGGLHLSDDLLSETLQGNIPPQDGGTLLQHLQAHCPQCEAYLSRRRTADALDGFLLAALFSGKAGHRSNPAMFARIMRRLRLDARLGSGLAYGAALRRRWNDRLPLTFAAFLGIFGLAVFAFSVTPKFSRHAERFQNQPASLELFWEPAGASVSSAEDLLSESSGRQRAAVCVPGQVLPESARLFLSYALRRSQFVAVLQMLPDESLELLEAPARKSPGRHVLVSDGTADGTPFSIDMHGTAGVNRFAVIASEHPIDTDDIGQMKLVLEMLLDRREASGSGTPGRQLFVSWMDVTVRAEDGAP